MQIAMTDSLVEVPEPSTIVLLSMGVIGLLFGAWRP